jgi:transcriptional regulator with XRE-family HTH domain
MHDWRATRLRVLRAERGLTVRQVAEASGVAKETISQIERGERHPYDRTLAKLAKAYDVPVEELLEEPVPLEQAPAKPGSGHPADSEAEEPRLSFLAQGILKAADGWASMLDEPGVDIGMSAIGASAVAELGQALTRQLADAGGLWRLPKEEREEVQAVMTRLSDVMNKLVSRMNEVWDAAEQVRSLSPAEQDRAVRERCEKAEELAEKKAQGLWAA